MSGPTPTSGYPADYEPTTDFSASPFNKANLDTEFDGLAERLTHLRALIMAVVRDDWKLADGLVSFATLDPAVQAQLSALT